MCSAVVGGCGPCPHGSCLPGRVASQTDRAYESQAFKGSSAPAGSCSKASLWQEGPSRAAAPATGTDRAQPLCRRAGPALTQGQPDRGSCLRGAGDLPGEGLPWAQPRPRMGAVRGARPWEPPPTSQISSLRGRAPGWRLAWGGGVAAGGLAGHTVTTW